jgi:EAL domain-containing protein (putative c-di-GMP-specific phosphodiesterase class I)
MTFPNVAAGPTDDATREADRLASLAAYGLLDPDDALSVGAALAGHPNFARRLTGAHGAAVTIVGDRDQQTIALSGGVSPAAAELVGAMCARVLYATGSDGVFVAGDIDSNPGLRDGAAQAGACDEFGPIRFFAGAALSGREGLPLGMLCVWSTEAISDLDAERAGYRLMPVRDSVVELLEARRRAQHHRATLAGAILPEAARAELEEISGVELGLTPGSGPIDVVIDGGTVLTVFQPIVHLGTGAVVAFEALTRGPAGTELESPSALLDAARQAGRLGEFDWLCRASAMRAAADSALPAGLSWFINVEPAGLETDCPQHLRPAVDAARDGLRVVLEVVERDVEDHVTRLLHATDQARRDSWGVALDDVGAAVGSLALLPFLQPDVVKLDMSLLREAPSATAAAITAAVRSYAEHTGAVILAEGIETDSQEELAAVFGATYGQGYLYGSPGPLPASLPGPIEPIPLRQRPAPLHGATPFQALSATKAIQLGRPEHLMHIVNHLRRYWSHSDEGVVMLVLFHSTEVYHENQQFIDAVAKRNALTICLAPGVKMTQPHPRYYVGPIPEQSRLDTESAIIVITPHYAGALVIRKTTQTASDGTPLSDYIYTHDRAAIIDAARAFLYNMKPGTGHYPSTPAADADNHRTEENRRSRLITYLARRLSN